MWLRLRGPTCITSRHNNLIKNNLLPCVGAVGSPLSKEQEADRGRTRFLSTICDPSLSNDTIWIWTLYRIFVFGPRLVWYHAEVNLAGDEVFLGLVQIFQDHPVPPLIGSKTKLFELHELLDRPKCSGGENILYSACPPPLSFLCPAPPESPDTVNEISSAPNSSAPNSPAPNSCMLVRWIITVGRCLEAGFGKLSFGAEPNPIPFQQTQLTFRWGDYVFSLSSPTSAASEAFTAITSVNKGE
jgi:hypothetical protein